MKVATTVRHAKNSGTADLFGAGPSGGKVINHCGESRQGRLRFMAHTHLCCLLHVVFSTAERRPLIREEMRDRLHAYLGGIARENAMAALAVGGVADYVHLLLSLPRTLSVSKAVQLLKAGSSKWINESFVEFGRFSWQEGYRAFSIVAQREKTVAYIRAQAEHHKRASFTDEFKKFLATHCIQEEQ